MDTVRILLADDHAVVRAGIRNALEELPNLQIIGEVGDGPSLLHALDNLQPDCLLTDVTMPEFEPISTIRQIRALYPRLLILVVSAYDDDVYVQGLLSEGVNGYHLKDQPLSDLRLAIERIVTGKRWVSSSLLDKLLQPARRSHGLPTLSSRQQDILRFLVSGLDNRTIARQLQLSVKTIENHLTRLYRQLNVHSRLEAANMVRNHPDLLGQTRAAPIQTPSIKPVPHGKASILIVDDNQRYRHQLRRIISKVFPQAMIYDASTTSESMRYLEKISPQLAFVDVVLGEEDGISCTRRMKSAKTNMRIVLISAYPDREFHRRGLEAGATAFLDKKDLDAATLQQIIEDAIS
jgi:DNA-binding NarL/FixJ family response regulator